MPYNSPFGAPPNIGISLLRIGAGITLLYMHAWHQAGFAWNFSWNRQPWDVVESVSKAGLPLAGILAGTAAAIALFTSVSWILGFATRFSSVIFMPVALGTLLVCNRSENSIGAECSILYLFIALALLIQGPGWIAVDSLFGGGSSSRRKKGGSGYLNLKI